MSVVSCSICLAKRIVPTPQETFLCESCLFKVRHPPKSIRAFKDTPNRGSLSPLPTKEKIEVPAREREYRQYLLSKDWHSKRMAAFEHYGRFCMACGTNEKLHVHHKTYRNLGSENMQDLAILCFRCHDELHKEYDKRKARLKATWSRRDTLFRFSNRFIKRKVNPYASYRRRKR